MYLELIVKLAEAQEIDYRKTAGLSVKLVPLGAEDDIYRSLSRHVCAHILTTTALTRLAGPISSLLREGTTDICGAFYRMFIVTRKLVRPKGPLFAAKISPNPDHFWLPKVVRVAKSVVRVF